ncbi:MAG TPA: choice-of-anchor D domain-containing protein [Casimicrobiaceae bacterium]|nr:choice-of-anchor D domain-containing protein [Casimicrobiaceae bacterium]
MPLSLRNIALLSLALSVGCPGAAHAAGADGATDFIVRAVPRAPIALDKFKFVFGPAFRWASVPVHWTYNPANAPSPFDVVPDNVAPTIQIGMGKWSAVCGVTFIYDGMTTRLPTQPHGSSPDQHNVVAWGSVEDYVAGAAGVTHTYYLPARDGSGSLYDSDIVLDNTGRIPTQGVLDTIAVHEVGHMLGLSHSELTGNVMSGPPESAYNGLAALQTDDVRGCRCMYGPATGQSAGFTCSLPKRLEFGAIPVGSTSVGQAFTVYNDGNAALTVSSVTGGGSEVQIVGGCPAGSVLAPGDRCTVSLTATPNAPGNRVQILTVATSDGSYTVPAIYTGTNAPAATIEAVEYHNAGLDHYFITWVANEIAILDAGLKSHGWIRTGEHFSTYPAAQAGASPLCRYYIPPDKGNSHFYGRGTTECTRTGQSNPSFVLEDPAFMYMILPANGTCPAATTPVYRVFSNRPDANHRYTTSRAIRDQMVGEGWLAEGDGPDLVVMCAPT